LAFAVTNFGGSAVGTMAATRFESWLGKHFCIRSFGNKLRMYRCAYFSGLNKPLPTLYNRNMHLRQESSDPDERFSAVTHKEKVKKHLLQFSPLTDVETSIAEV
jgi:hypothetical protein